jgi:TM2 domain-containing membrane protein YozV
MDGPGPQPQTTRFAVGKTPAVAFVFSIVPSLGQFYNGDFKKGILVLVCIILAFGISPATGCLSLLPGMAVWLWAGVNAYNVAAGKTPLWA